MADEESAVPLWELLIVSACLAVGGILKGATGAGAPILAVPALAAFYDVRFAIVVMTIPNLVTNAMQAWQNHSHRLDRRFLVPFFGAAVVGVSLGTWALAGLDAGLLSLGVAFAVLAYVALRIFRSHWRLGMPQARRLALPFGLLSGLLQGVSGISAPVSVSFLSAMHLGRETFMSTVSLLFVTFALVQLPALTLAGILDASGLGLSVLALLPMLVGMPVGAALMRRLSREGFDRVVLALLAALAVYMIWQAAWP